MFEFDILPQTSRSSELQNTVFLVGNGNRNFGIKIAQNFKEKYDCIISSHCPDYFASGEVYIKPIENNIRQRDIVIIQSMIQTENKSVNDLLMELYLLIDSVKRGSAKTITVVLPMYPYQRQDRKDNSRTPISARVITTILESLGVSRVISFDLHAGQIQGFFGTTPLDNLFSEPYFIKYIKTILTKEELDKSVIVSPDEGGLKRVVRMSKKMNLPSAFMYKERLKANEVDKMVVMGEVKDKICVIIDDMIDTAGTACKAAQLLKDNGALKVIMCACHGVFSGPAIDRIKESYFDKVAVTNTVISVSNEEKIDIIDVSKLASLAIE
jgi:ribose-phosphate pyrophosphokinase